MNANLIQQTNPKAKKHHRCIWCPEKIAIGESYVKQVGTFDGDFQSMSWHLECLVAFEKYYAETHENEIFPHGCKRGTSEAV